VTHVTSADAINRIVPAAPTYAAIRAIRVDPVGGFGRDSAVFVGSTETRIRRAGRVARARA
jgi:hypothetical protein